jgi:4a-hydroxytetrahydrobiopterin dehydratase
MRAPVLAEPEVIDLLAAPDGPEWHLIGGKLVKTVVCPSFMAALGFVNRVGQLAESADHHPDIDIRYNRVTLSLITHDSGGITARDVDLARAIDDVAVGLPPPD